MKSFCTISLLLVLFTGSSALAQTTFVIDAVPAHYTPLLENIYLAPSFDTWNPGDVNYKFSKHSDGKYYLTFNTKLDTPMQFKFTRGDWTRVEVTAAGADIANRTFNFNTDTVHFTIAQWHDMLIGANTATSNVNILITNFNIPQLSTTRRLWVYLPSDYYTSGINYPVLYMQDGQNVFDALYSFAGEWKVDESLVIAGPVRDCIVIAIDNGPNRIGEYSPFVDPTDGGGLGDQYMAFMVNTLKPFIDSVFRTLPQQEHTGILGSSLGGLISLYGGLKYPEVYGRIGSFSPSIWFDNYAVDGYAAGITPSAFQKIYFTAGTNESTSDNVVNDVSGMTTALTKVGYTSDEHR
jgi:predicted alpha/beta superfamily hydrolase